MKKTLLGIAAAIGMVCSSASADLVVEYDGTTGTVKGAINGMNATGQDLARGAGVDEAAGANFNSTSFSSIDLAEALIAQEYLTFGFNVNAGMSLDMDNILVEMDRSVFGPDTAYLLFDGDSNGFDAGDLLSSDSIPDSSGLLTFNTSLPTNLTAMDGFVEFRFYFSGTTFTGFMDIEDDLIGGSTGNVGLQLNGTFSAIPEPGSALILIGMAGGLFVRRKR